MTPMPLFKFDLDVSSADEWMYIRVIERKVYMWSNCKFGEYSFYLDLPQPKVWHHYDWNINQFLLIIFKKNCEQQGGIGCKSCMQCFDLYCDGDQV